MCVCVPICGGNGCGVLSNCILSELTKSYDNFLGRGSVLKV